MYPLTSLTFSLEDFLESLPSLSPRMQVEELLKVCSQRLIDVVEVTEENVVSLLDLTLLYPQEMTGGVDSFLKLPYCKCYVLH